MYQAAVLQKWKARSNQIETIRSLTMRLSVMHRLAALTVTHE
jgi:hypothetical protein